MNSRKTKSPSHSGHSGPSGKKTASAARKSAKPVLRAKPKIKTRVTLKIKPKIKFKPTVKTGKSGKSGLEKLLSFLNLKSLWGVGVIAAVSTIGYGMWSSHQPLEAPAPVQLPPVAHVEPPAQPASEAPAPPAVQTAQQTTQVVGHETAPASLKSVPSGAPLATRFDEASQKDLPGRIAYWSRYLWNLGQNTDLVGKAFAKELGEVPVVNDTAPLIPSQFDCTTYVETVSALARSHTVDGFFKNLIAIRYRDGKPGFTSRNHFPEIDWIPNNEAAGILRDVTQDVASAGSVTARVVTKTIDRAKWFAEQFKQGHVDRGIASVDPTWGKPVEAKVAYLEIAKLPQILDKLPDGAIVNLVRQDSDHHPVVIAHQGFLIREGKRVLIRHASATGHIRTLDLIEYLDKLGQAPNSRTWPILGINLNQLNG